MTLPVDLTDNYLFILTYERDCLHAVTTHQQHFFLVHRLLVIAHNIH